MSDEEVEEESSEGPELDPDKAMGCGMILLGLGVLMAGFGVFLYLVKLATH